MDAFIQFLKQKQIEHSSIVHSTHIKLYWQIGDYIANNETITNSQLNLLHQYNEVVFNRDNCSTMQRFAESIPNIVLVEILAPYLSWQQIKLVLQSGIIKEDVLAYLLYAIENTTKHDALKIILAQKTLVPATLAAKILATAKKRQYNALSKFLNGKQTLFHQHLDGNIDEAFENTLFSQCPVQIIKADTNVAAIVTIINNAFNNLNSWMPTFLNMKYWHLGRILGDVSNEAMADLFNIAQQHCKQLITLPIMQQSKLFYTKMPDQLEATNFCAGKTWHEVMEAVAL